MFATHAYLHGKRQPMPRILERRTSVPAVGAWSCHDGTVVERTTPLEAARLVGQWLRTRAMTGRGIISWGVWHVMVFDVVDRRLDLIGRYELMVSAAFPVRVSPVGVA